MICSKCDTENENNENLCSSCGLELEGKKNEIIFKDAKILTSSIKYLLYIFILTGFINASFGINEFMIWKNVENGLVFESEAQASIAIYNDYNSYNAYFGVFSLLILFILVPLWIYRMNKNSKSLGAVNMKFSPIWSIAWYFIPIFNLWKPYQAMKELYQTSVNPKSWENVKVPKFLAWWWTFWISSFLFNNSTTGDYNAAQTTHEFLGATSLWVFTSFAEVLSGVFLLIILNIIYKKQMKYSSSIIK